MAKWTLIIRDLETSELLEGVKVVLWFAGGQEDLIVHTLYTPANGTVEFVDIVTGLFGARFYCILELAGYYDDRSPESGSYHLGMWEHHKTFPYMLNISEPPEPPEPNGPEPNGPEVEEDWCCGTCGECFDSFQEWMAHTTATHGMMPECFIATAALGTEVYDHLDVLRQVRNGMLNNRILKYVVKIYYKLSPFPSKCLIYSKRVKTIIKTGVKGLIGIVRRKS